MGGVGIQMQGLAGNCNSISLNRHTFIVIRKINMYSAVHSHFTEFRMRTALTLTNYDNLEFPYWLYLFVFTLTAVKTQQKQETFSIQWMKFRKKTFGVKISYLHL